MEKDFQIKENVLRNICLYLLFIFAGNVIYKSLLINELPNPDAIWNGMIYKESWYWECSLGRYMIRVFQNLFDNIINPTSMTILAICSLAFVSVVVSETFKLKGIRAMLCGILIILTPAVTGTLSYYYCSLYYLIAYMLAVVAAYIMCRKTEIIWGFLAAVLLCMSLATYQAYIGCTIVIALLYLIVLVFDNESDFSKLIRRIIYMGGILVLGIFLYLISNRIIQSVWKVSAESGRGFSSMGHIPVEKMLGLIKNAYIYTYQYFFTSDMINNFDGLICKRYINVFFVVIILFTITNKWFSCKKQGPIKIVGLVGIVLLPIAVMSITIAAPDVSIYDSTGMIMLPTTNYIYLLPILLLGVNNNRKERLIKYGLYLGSCFLLISLFNYSSAMQVYQKTKIQKMNYVAGNIVKELEKHLYDGKEYQVCIVGDMEEGNYPELYPELAEKVQWTTASYGTVWNNYSGRQACWREYIKGYFGVDYESCDYEKFNEIIEDSQFKEAAIFPEDSSVFVFDDAVIVVKLS